MIAYRALLVTLFGNLILFGVAVSLVGAAIPAIIRDLGWTYLNTGAVLAAGSAAYLASTFLCGFLVRRAGPRAVIVVGMVVEAAGLGLFGVWPGVTANMAAMVLVGLGQGGTEVVANYCVVHIERSGQSRIMNLMHAAFTVGAVAGPLAVGALLRAALPWRFAFGAAAAGSAVAALAFATVDFAGAGTRPPPAGSAPQALAGLLRRPLLGLLGLVVFLYVGAEMGVASWIAEYFVGVHGVSVSAAAYTVSVFWGGLLCGRFLAWAAYRGHRQEHFLVALTVTATLGTGLALVAPSAPLALALFFAGGLGYSAIYPVVMTITGLRFRDEPSLAIGAVSTSGGIGSMAFPYIMSGIADRYGVARGFWFYGAVTAAMVAVALAVLWVNRGSAGERDDQAGLVGEPPGAVPPPDLRT